MYTILKWNKTYGTKAQFIVKDNDTGKQALFSPARSSDIAWVDKDLTEDEEYKKWDDFGKEQVKDIKDIVF
jgi:hypothetical protein